MVFILMRMNNRAEYVTLHGLFFGLERIFVAVCRISFDIAKLYKRGVYMRFHKEFALNPMIVFLFMFMLANTVFIIITYQGLMTWLVIAIGVLLFGLFEYITHRYLLHEWPRLASTMYKGHMAHHEHPNENKYLFGPARYDMVAYAIYYIVLLAITRSFHMSSAITLGSSSLQYYYQWMHFVAHRPIKIITPWGRWMKKKHLLHHHMDEHAWYGVSNPVMDVIMGTNKPIRQSNHTNHSNQ